MPQDFVLDDVVMSRGGASNRQVWPVSRTVDKLLADGGCNDKMPAGPDICYLCITFQAKVCDAVKVRFCAAFGPCD